MVRALMVAMVCSPGSTTEELCFPRPESKGYIWKLVLFLDIYSTFWTNCSHAFPVGGLPSPQTLFLLCSFLIQKAACFEKVCLGLHCTHLFAMNEKHFSFLLNYCCQIPCVHMFLAILQGKLANLQSWCELLQQLKWLLSARPLPRLGNTHAFLSVRPQKEGFLQLDGNNRTAAQPPNSKHLTAFSLHSHPSGLLSTFGNTGSLEQEPLGKLRKHKGHEPKTVWLNAVLGLPFPGFFSSKIDDVRVVAIFHCLHWEGSVVVVSFQKGVGFFGF